MQAGDAAVSCPVCLAQFPPPRDGAAFALHVASCSAPPVSSGSATSGDARAGHAPPPPMRSCPMCLHVYARGTLPHEISFHEHECARVNARPRSASAASNKRARETPAAASATKEEGDEGEDEAAAAAPAIKLFPSACCLCGAGGRSLLRCEGSCARVFHLNCVEDLQAPLPPSASGEGGTSARRAQQQHWQCAECLRGLHRCHLCGFLGSDTKDLARCAVADCGRFFHRACLTERERGAREYVCPRHTCAKCGAMETDMARCLSCVRCDASTHLRCRPGAATQHAIDASPHASSAPSLPPPPAPAAVGASQNLHECAACAAEQRAVRPSAHVANSQRLRCANGDVVLVLEYGNALLPAPARAAAAGVYNLWGVVTSVETAPPAGAGNQLLSVSLFSDDSRVVVPNRYVLRVASANAFLTPSAMVRDLVKWHAMTELNLRASERAQPPPVETTEAALEGLCKAFAARLDALAIPASAALAQAAEGAAALQRFRRRAPPRCYQEEAVAPRDFAPMYMFLDTRPVSSTMISGATEPTGESTGERSGSSAKPPPSDGDVDMGEADEETKTEERMQSPPGNAGGGATSDATACTTEQAESVGSEVRREAGEDGDKDEDCDGQENEDDARHGATDGDKKREQELAVANGSPAGDGVADRCAHVADEVVAEKLKAKEEEEAFETVATRIETAKSETQTTAATGTLAGCAAIEDDAGVTESDLPTEKKVAKQETETGCTDAPAAGAAGMRDSPLKRASVSETEENAWPPVKRAKAAVEPVKPKPLQVLATKFSPLPAASTFNITQVLPAFALPQVDKPARAQADKPRRLTRKEALLAEFPPALISELERDVDDYLQRGQGGSGQGGSMDPRAHRLPKDADAFPWAAHAALFRPAFYRPAVVLNRARGGRRMAGVSRLLVSQDKRELKCFIQSAQQARQQAPRSGCPLAGEAPSRRAFLVVDLLSVESFAQLMAAVRSKLLLALADRPRFTQELFRMEPRAALRWLEQQQARRSSEQQLGLALSYCCFDGSRKSISLATQPPREAAADWLCFCANACHLTLALALPPVDNRPLRADGTRGL